MVALSAENFADSISSIQQVAAVASIVAVEHSTIRSCTDILMSSIHGVEEEATFYN
ncbi:MAG: hypothetical protein AB8V23_03295 [Candidatus Midichloria sp.]|uniref:Uncharacterized protein n=1 Tax=Hyalomma marginatum TaxID=34627 RepID=A0A8S4C286_9ACAR|nr:hypothetical protein MHYMCMPASI_00533 [Hyalomma marginatum]CAG7592929.1 hypothetical protein MHYMCMPSP_00758 [Hyalomma marginatum]